MEPILLTNSKDLIAKVPGGPGPGMPKGIEYLACIGSSSDTIFSQAYVVKKPLSNHLTTAISKAITCNITDQWFTYHFVAENKALTTALPSALQCPIVRISPALGDLPYDLKYGISGIPPSDPEFLRYLAVVEGQSQLHSVMCKVLWASSRGQIAEAIFSEVVNGYSVVFTGAMLVHDWIIWQNALGANFKTVVVNLTPHESISAVNAHKREQQQRGNRKVEEEDKLVLNFALWC